MSVCVCPLLQRYGRGLKRNELLHDRVLEFFARLDRIPSCASYFTLLDTRGKAKVSVASVVKLPLSHCDYMAYLCVCVYCAYVVFTSFLLPPKEAHILLLTPYLCQSDPIVNDLPF